MVTAVRTVPPEVTVDLHGLQIVAQREDGSPYDQYVLCSEGCGYLIGCGDAIDMIAHASCLQAASAIRKCARCSNYPSICGHDLPFAERIKTVRPLYGDLPTKGPKPT